MPLPSSLPTLPVRCEHRRSVAHAASLRAECGLLRRLAGAKMRIDATVSPDACQACRRHGATEAGRINPVVASLLHAASSRLAVDPSASPWQQAQARLLSGYAVRHLATAGVNRQPTSPPRLPPEESCWQLRHRPRIGLVGPNTPTGLGSVNRDIADYLPVSRWLVSRHPTDRFPMSVARSRRRIVSVELDASEEELLAWLRGLDWLLFVERPAPAALIPLAKAAGVLVGCVCNWEWTCPAVCDWLYDVDLLICPTRHTWQLMKQWKKRFGFGWHVFHQPWPIDVRRFRFRQRRRCDRVLFVNGTGGVQGRHDDGSSSRFHRKGVEVLFEAARLVPHIPFLVSSQSLDLPPLPRNVELRPHQLDNRSLYADGDVCVQPSHWEGLGLQLVECQAAGMPLVTTDAAPMNEYQPADTIPVVSEELVYLEGCQPVPAQLMSAESLAKILSRWYGRDVSSASAAARRYVRQNHNWSKAVPRLICALTETPKPGSPLEDEHAVIQS